MTVPIDRYAQALEQLRAGGLVLDHIELSRSIRVPVEGDKGGKRSGWYVVHEIVLKDGSKAYVGRFQNWKLHSEPQSLRFELKKLGKEDRAALGKRAAEAKAAAELERTEKAKSAADRAQRMWPRMKESGRSDYLVARGVKAYGIRFAWRGTLAVPVRNESGDLVGLQFIGEDASKKFLTGTPKQGAFHAFGEFESDEPIAIGEGYATLASVHEATTWPCVVAFDAGNLLVVARKLRARYQHRKIVLIADDDHETSAGNKGKTLATAAAAAVQAHLALPTFKDARGRTDFNDMHRELGLTAVRDRLLEAIGLPPPAPPEQVDQEWDFSPERMLERFTVIFGTSTAFDHLRQKIIGISELRIGAGGNKTVNHWLKNPKVRRVAQENVVFDPSCRADPAKTINLYRGMGMKPAEGSCELQLQLLNYICGGGEQNEAYDWVLKWLAFPLKHPGAKMQTALILHGPEGVGKNLFFGALREIYGEYGGIISQSELENRFNGWASAKLFLIGNEVVNRAELYHVKGKLKNMITETEWVIEEKNMPHRFEANHCNFAFFSNAIQPAGLDPDDRRYMIVYTPHPQKAEFYQAVRKEQLEGGIAALYHHLINIELGDFTEHTKPMITQAKADLIELGMDTHERFFRQWKAGELPIRYAPCLTMDLYQGYRHWCRERGERAVAREAVFSGAMHKRVPKVKKKWLSEDPMDGEKQNMFFIPESHAFELSVTEAVQLGKCVSFFRQQLTGWTSPSGGERGEGHD